MDIVSRYPAQGGANSFGWFFNGYPQAEYDGIGKVSGKIHSWEKKQAQAAESGKAIPAAEVPKEARSDEVTV